MILFENDWLQHPGAIIDDKTKNVSARLLAAKYRKMGVRNNAFFLALHNPRLQGVGPYSPNLTFVQMLEIGVECKNNPWYFFREVARAPSNAGTEGAMVEFNRANISLWWSFYNHVTYTLVQPRQTGKSFCTDILMSELMLCQCTNTQINLLTKDEILRKSNIDRLKKIYEELPRYLQIKTREDANNTEMLTVKKNGNKYVTHVPQASEKRANAQGRGLTTPIIHIDEAPFQVNIEHSFPAAMGAMGAAIQDAKRNNEPYGTILTTTAGQKDDRDGKYVYKFAMESAPWSEKFFDAVDAFQLEEMVRRSSRVVSAINQITGKEETKGVFRIYGAFNHRQLGKDDAWLRDQLERQGGTPDKANRDYFNIWTNGSVTSPLSPEIVSKLNAGVVEDYHETISVVGAYITRWHIPADSIEYFMRTRKTIAGVDTSDASGKDAIAVVLTDVETGAVIAVSKFNETNLTRFAQWVMWFLTTYENTTMIIERRSSAPGIIDHLLLYLPEKGIDPFKRLFNWVANDPLLHKERYAETRQMLSRRPEDLYVRCKSHFGFATSGSGETSRTALYSTTLQNAAQRCADKIMDKELTGQITSLENRNGRVDHEEGGHDDLVIAWLLTHWFLTMAKNLQFYGIDARSILVDHKPKEELNAMEQYSRVEQQKLRVRIEAIYEELSTEADSFICDKLEKELRFLDSRIVLEYGESFSVDTMIKQAKEQRRSSYTHSNLYGGDTTYYNRMGYNVAQGSGDRGLSDRPFA